MSEKQEGVRIRVDHQVVEQMEALQWPVEGRLVRRDTPSGASEHAIIVQDEVAWRLKERAAVD